MFGYRMRAVPTLSTDQYKNKGGRRHHGFVESFFSMIGGQPCADIRDWCVCMPGMSSHPGTYFDLPVLVWQDIWCSIIWPHVWTTVSNVPQPTVVSTSAPNHTYD
jgi:hypothetical protein